MLLSIGGHIIHVHLIQLLELAEYFNPDQTIEHVKYINCLNNVQVELI